MYSDMYNISKFLKFQDHVKIIFAYRKSEHVIRNTKFSCDEQNYNKFANKPVSIQKVTIIKVCINTKHILNQIMH